METDELEAMSMEDLEAHVAKEGAIEAPGSGENAPAQATSDASGGESVGKAADTSADDAPPKWFQEYQTKSEQNLKRELGSLRSLQGLGDKLPKLIEQQLEARLAKLQQQQNLSPEDREAQAQLQTQQAALDKYIQEKALGVFGDAAKDYLPLLQKLQEQNQDMSHRSSAMELVKDVIPEKAEEAWNEIFEQSYKDIVAGKPGAIERQEKLEKDPAYVALAMITAQHSKVQQQSNQVTIQRTNAAKAAAQGVKPSAVGTTAKKSVNEMDENELNGLSIAELEAALPEQSR